MTPASLAIDWARSIWRSDSIWPESEISSTGPRSSRDWASSRPMSTMHSSSRVRAATSSYRPRVVRSAIASASRRASRSRSSRRLRRSISAAWLRAAVPLAVPFLTKAHHQGAGGVAAEHAAGLVDRDVLGEVVGRTGDEALRERAQPALRLVAHDEGPVGGGGDVEPGDVRPGVHLPDFGMDDVVQGQE